MADEDEQSADGDDSGGDALTARELTRSARETVEELTGYGTEGVSAMQWDGESWLITVDVCELHRIPNTTDLMATYVVQVDDRGRLLGYQRTRRFARGQAEGQG
jgi:hypothetical protein